MGTFGFESMVKSHHFIENTAKTPYIWLLIIHFIFPNLWCHNTRCPNFSLSHIKSSLHIFGDPKITNFDLIGSRYEYIFTFKIPMQYPMIMYILNSMTHLDKPLHYFILTQWIITIFPHIEISLQFPILSIFHNNTNITIIIFKIIIISDNILMT